MKPLHERVRELREARELSQPQLYREAQGVGLDTLRGVETPPGKSRHRYPSPRVLEAIATALGVPADHFPEYRLARARRLLDEREVGLDAAIANLEVFEAVVQSVSEKLPDDERVSRLLSGLAATRRPGPGGGDRATPPGSASTPTDVQAKDRPGQ